MKPPTDEVLIRVHRILGVPSLYWGEQEMKKAKRSDQPKSIIFVHASSIRYKLWYKIRIKGRAPRPYQQVRTRYTSGHMRHYAVTKIEYPVTKWFHGRIMTYFAQSMSFIIQPRYPQYPGEQFLAFGCSNSIVFAHPGRLEFGNQGSGTT